MRIVKILDQLDKILDVLGRGNSCGAPPTAADDDEE